MTQWDGKLLLAQGWAHYHGRAGDTAFHAHYPMQIVFSGSHETTVTIEDHQVSGQLLRIPSNARHMLAPSREPIDLLYVEPTLLEKCEMEEKSLSAWLAALRHQKAASIDPKIIRALEAVDDGLDGKIAQHDIASTAGMSKSSFTKLFRATIGMPLRRYVLWRRLNAAVTAISDGTDATTAAHRAGFSDQAHFSRTMKKTFGVSPTDSLLSIKMTGTAYSNRSILSR